MSLDITLTAEDLAARSASMNAEDWRTALSAPGAPQKIHDLVIDDAAGNGRYAVVRDLNGYASYDSGRGWEQALHPEGLRSCLSEDARSALDLTLSTWELEQASQAY